MYHFPQKRILFGSDDTYNMKGSRYALRIVCCLKR